MTFTPTVTSTPNPVIPFYVKAEPNTTDGTTPVQFVISLPSSMNIILGVFDVADELVYIHSYLGSPGINVYSWKPQNQNSEPLANGVYIYYVQAEGSAGKYQKLGKILVKR